MEYRPNAKKIEEGKSPLLSSHFCLSKSSKRMLCNARNSDERALIKQLLIDAEISALKGPSKKENARRNGNE
jgi:hypothetical protein